MPQNSGEAYAEFDCVFDESRKSDAFRRHDDLCERIPLASSSQEHPKQTKRRSQDPISRRAAPDRTKLCAIGAGQIPLHRFRTETAQDLADLETAFAKKFALL